MDKKKTAGVSRSGEAKLERGVLDMLRGEREAQPGTIEWFRKYGTTRKALDATITNIENKIAENDPRVPGKGSQVGKRVEEIRYDEDGTPISGSSRFAF